MITIALLAAVLSSPWWASLIPGEVGSVLVRQPAAGAPVLGHGSSWDGQTYQGFMTTGCGDAYVYSPSGGTWRVEAAGGPLAEMKKLGTFSDMSHRPWLTTRIELEGQFLPGEKPGFFGKHVGSLILRRALRHLDSEYGDTTAVAAESKTYLGYLIAGPEGTGFAWVKSRDELWSVVSGKMTWSQFYKSLGPVPNLENGITYVAYVEIVGRVGPPGALIDYEREMSMDNFRYLRPMKPDEMNDTALVEGLPFDGKGRGGARFNHCLQPMALS